MVPGAPVVPRAPVANPGPVLMYDGVCGLCNRYVQFVLGRDRRRRFRFAPLQGLFATQALARHGLHPIGDPNTIVLLESPGSAFEQVHVRSDAVLAIMTGLGGPWRLVVVLRVIPRFLRDAVYDVVARFRYRFFGRFDACPVPSPSSRDRFLD